MASRFWKAQPASAVANNGSGKCRVTVSSTTGMTTGDTRLFFGFTGTTGLNGSQTITVISGTTLDVSAVAFVATGTGSINGFWDTTNTNNWVSTSNGTDYGQTVPGSADSAALDGSSGGGTVTPNFGGTITIQSLAMGAFTGTFDNSVNNNNFSFSLSGTAFSGSGSATRTIKLGTATYTLTGNGTLNFSTITGLTFTGSGSTIAYTSAGAKTFNSGALTFGTVTVSAHTSSALDGFTLLGSGYTIGTLNVSPPNDLVMPAGPITITTLNLNGTASSQILMKATSSTFAGLTVSGSIGQWAALNNMQITGSPTLQNGFDLGGNSGITINAPGPFGRQNIYQRGTPF